MTTVDEKDAMNVFCQGRNADRISRRRIHIARPPDL